MYTKMYVMVYKGKGMYLNNRLIGDSCYMYKDEFKEGDKIVVKSYREYKILSMRENRSCKVGI